MTVQVVVGAAIIAEGRLLAAQRAEPADMRGRWELPGGSVEPGESEAEALTRELHEELALAVVIRERIGPDLRVRGRHGRDLVLRFYRCTPGDGAVPRALEHLAVRWVGPDELDDLDWLDSDRELLPALRAALHGTATEEAATEQAPAGEPG